MNWPTAELVTSSRTATNIQRVGFTVLCCAMAGGVAQNVDGAEEGTRTPTPLRVHGPEPCASANSATSACDLADHRIPCGRDAGRTTFLFYRRYLPCQTSASYNQKIKPIPAGRPIMTNPQKLPADVANQLRELVHDLSNSIETIMQASYLLGQLEIPSHGKKWVEVV